MQAATTVGSPVRQFSVFMKNRVGELAKLIKWLNEEHVHVLGMSVQDSVDVTILRLVVSDPETVERIFKEKGIGSSSCSIMVVELDEGAAGLMKCVNTLFMAETNIHFSYPLLCRPHGKATLALHLDDIEFGTSVLINNGFKLLQQEDLSR